MAHLRPETHIGYARVSTADQSLELQVDALKDCAKVFTDTASGRGSDRPGLSAALKYVRAGDTLTVWKLDRLGRSVAGLIQLADALERRGVNLKSLTDGIDTTTAAGRFFFHMLAALAQMERELISERTLAGLAAARARGRRAGRPRVGPLTGKQMALARTLFAAGEDPAAVAKALGLSLSTVYRRVPQSIRQLDFIETAAAHQRL